ncbi:MAG: hypothetical protein ACKD6N_03255 [Candidatus Bathyarchaeota archaeon]
MSKVSWVLASLTLILMVIIVHVLELYFDILFTPEFKFTLLYLPALLSAAISIYLYIIKKD